MVWGVPLNMARKEKTVFTMQTKYMDQYQAQLERNKRRKRRLIQRLVAMGILIMIVSTTFVLYHANQRILYAEKAVEYEALQEEMAELKKEEKELLEEINLLNDEEYILDIARTNYFLSKEGELIFQVQEP